MLESQLQLNGALDALSPGETMLFINVSGAMIESGVQADYN